MAKLNGKAKNAAMSYADRPDATENEEGGLAFKTDKRTELFLRAASTLVAEPHFYGPSKTTDDAIVKLVHAVADEHPEYPLQLAAYLRGSLHLRSVPILILVESSRHQRAKWSVRKWTPAIIQRADDLTEAVGYWTSTYGSIGDLAEAGSLPASLKKGLADSFHKFNEYAFAKYDRDGAVKLRDVVRIVHPRPEDVAEAELFGRIVSRTLAIPDTWETFISANGSSKDTWSAILPNMGIMARIRNLRNFVEHDVDITDVVGQLEDSTEIEKSKQFPYRYYSAYRALDGFVANPKAKRLRAALSHAMDLSVANIPNWPGTTVVMVDLSGSMDVPVSAKSTINLKDAASVMGSIAHRISDDGYLVAFGSTAALVDLNADDSVLTNVTKIRAMDRVVGGGTYAGGALNAMRGAGIKADRILLFSDMQCYGADAGYGRAGYDEFAPAFLAYRQKASPKCWLHSFDLSNYGTVQFPQSAPRVSLAGGFSDRILEFVAAVEDGGAKAAQHVATLTPHKPGDDDEDEL